MENWRSNYGIFFLPAPGIAFWGLELQPCGRAPLLAMQVIPPAASPVRIGTDPCWTSYESVYWARPPPNQCGLHIFQALCFARGKNTQYRDFLPVKPFMLTAIRDAFRVYQSAVFHICAGQSIAASVNTMLTARVLLAAKLQPRRGGDPVG